MGEELYTNERDVIELIDQWREVLERTRSRGYKSASGPHDNSMYEWLDLKDIIREMEQYVQEERRARIRRASVTYMQTKV